MNEKLQQEYIKLIYLILSTDENIVKVWSCACVAEQWL